ncbi:hypothetical protein SCUCBS95973_004392 [Sporothrix curviconia]|uniref:Uncharacterized protein n=1 Tax=Sporothrix curviconia TaxID=1260050 RepID=A0ABP0BNN3_9PEZI
MATEAELAPRPSAASASLADDDLKRILEFDRIVKLSEAITSGKHPRIKIPPHLKAALLANGSGVHDTHLGDNLAAFGQNSQMLVEATVAGSLPGLGAASGVRAISPSKVSPDEIPLQRARVEALIREQAEQRAKIVVSDPAHIDFIVGDVLQKARELQRTFTPPPVAILTQDDMSGRGDASARPRANVASSSAAVDSVDDQTFYSSNFSTPEFALTSRIPIDEDNDDVSMHGSSNYEPELDSIPSPKLPSQPQPQSQPQPHLEVQPLQLQAGELQQFVSQQPTPEQLAPLLAQISNRTPAEILTSLLGPNYDPNTLTQPPLSAVYQDATQIQATDAAALLAAWGKHLPGLSGLPQPGAGAGASTSAHQQVAAGNPKPSSPFVRTHDLSPIAPQPAHISSLAVAAQLPLAVEGQQNTSQGTFAQLAV